MGEAAGSVQGGDGGEDGRTLIPGDWHVADVSLAARSTDLSIISNTTKVFIPWYQLSANWNCTPSKSFVNRCHDGVNKSLRAKVFPFTESLSV